jgi:exopolysaccharide biosynthesis predicted pyruvyltransferase EpsI
MLTNSMLDMIGNKPKIYYLGVPTHENLGDAAQYMCIREWIKENFPEKECVEIRTAPFYIASTRKKLKGCITADDIIIFQSGATFSHRHEDCLMHRFVLDAFPDNRIIFFPQTVDLSSKKELSYTATKFNNAQRAFFLARDVVSYKKILEYFDNKRVSLCPDIVTTLIGNFPFKETERKGILLCKRIDGEKIYTDSSIKELVLKLESEYGKVDWTDTNFFHGYDETMQNIESEVQNIIEYYAKYKVVITDRFHGVIFSLIANTPVVVLGTYDHKVREGALWFNKIYPESIFFCESFEEAKERVDTLMSTNVKLTNKSVFKEQFYDKLKDIILCD